MKKVHIQFISAMLIFGFNGILATAIPWYSYEIVLARTSIGALFMLSIIFINKKPFKFYNEVQSFKVLIISGILMGLNWMFLYEAYNQLGVGLAQIFNSTGPAVAMFLSPFLFKEKLEKHKILSLTIVALGMFFVYSNNLSVGLTSGLLCGIGGCLTYAGFLICNHFPIKIKAAERTMWQLTVASIMVLTFIIYRGTGFPNFSFKILLPVLIIGIISTGFAMNIMFAAIQKLPLQTVSIYSYLEPMSALVFSALILKERMTFLQIIGITLILGGTTFSELYKTSNKNKN